MDKNNRDDEYLLVVNPIAFKDSIEYKIKFNEFQTANGRVNSLCNQLNLKKRRICTVPCSPPETGDDCQAPCNPERISQLEKDIERVKELKDFINDIAGKYDNSALTSIPSTQMNTCTP